MPIENAIAALARPFNNHDFSKYPLDEPFPDLGDLGRNSQQAGSNKINLTLPNTSLKDFVALVVPLLQARGIYRTEYGEDTFRGNLGLPFPENQYSRRAAAQAEAGLEIKAIEDVQDALA